MVTITATQGQRPNGQRCIAIRFGFIVHRRTARQAMKLAYDILSLLCPECGELLAGNRCTGCGTVFEYTKRGTAMTKGDTQPDTQYCIYAVVDYSTEQGREHDVVAVRCKRTIYKGGPIAEDCIESCRLFEPRVKYNIASCRDHFMEPS